MLKLFTPVKLGKVTLSHRIALAPLTRYRADDNHVPLPMVKTYYEQRASVPGTLLITEATIISPRAGGYPNVPGIWNQDQVKAWREITEHVHAKGSYIFCQLWALGRVANEDFQQARGFQVVSSSATQLDEEHAAPEALTEEEIQLFVDDFVHAAKNAMEAGFDGIEIHGANGYLVDQFIQDNVNKRTDSWGGSVENRSKFAFTVASAIASEIGPQHTAIRLSPFSEFQGMHMADPYPQFSHLTSQLKTLNLAYLHVVESRNAFAIRDTEAPPETVHFMADIWKKTSPFLLAGGFTPDTAKKAMDDYPDNDIITVFGRLYIPNPDLPFRIKEGLALANYDRSTFYNAGEERGYIDWPFSKEFEATKA